LKPSVSHENELLRLSERSRGRQTHDQTVS
jgi:hypothetical protein